MGLFRTCMHFAVTIIFFWVCTEFSNYWTRVCPAICGLATGRDIVTGKPAGKLG